MVTTFLLFQIHTFQIRSLIYRISVLIMYLIYLEIKSMYVNTLEKGIHYDTYEKTTQRK